MRSSHFKIIQKSSLPKNKTNDDEILDIHPYYIVIYEKSISFFINFEFDIHCQDQVFKILKTSLFSLARFDAIKVCI